MSTEVTKSTKKSRNRQGRQGWKGTAVLLALALSIAPGLTLSQESDPEYNRLVDEILEKTGALEIGTQMSALVVSQMMNLLRSSGSEMPDRAVEILEEEVNAGIAENMHSGGFARLMYPVYAQHLSKEDLKAMVAFYNTPAGNRIAAATPGMTQQGMLAGQEWGRALGPEVAERVLNRLREEGYLKE